MYRGEELQGFQDWLKTAGRSVPEQLSKFRPGHSHYELANSWETAQGIPSEVKKVFDSSRYDTLKRIRFCEGWVEDPIPLPGPAYPKKHPVEGYDPYDPGSSTFNDISVLGVIDDAKVGIAVEGKVDERFGDTIGNWLNRSQVTCEWNGKQRNWRSCRLQEIKRYLGLRKVPQNLGIQLLYRTIGSVGFAEQVGAKSAVMLVHTFSERDSNLQDFQDFVRLFGAECGINEAVSLGRIRGIDAYAAWVKSEQRNL